MNPFKPLKWYRSYEGNDSNMSSYCTSMLDGSLLIAQAVQGGVEYILWKENDRKEMIIPISDNMRTCIGIVGIRVKETENLILLIKEKGITNCSIILISFPSNYSITKEDLLFPKSRCSLHFIPTCMKLISVPVDSNDQDEEMENRHYLFLGKSDGSASVYRFHTDVRTKRRFDISDAFYGFFPHISSPLLSVDLISINPRHRIWAFGYNNGLVCVYNISGVSVTEHLQVKPVVHEYGPLMDGNTIRPEELQSQKLVLAAYLSSPVYEVRLLIPFGEEEEQPLRVDLLATCFEQTLLRFTDVLRNGLMNPSPLCNMQDVSCVNCIEVVKGSVDDNDIVIDVKEKVRKELREEVRKEVREEVREVITPSIPNALQLKQLLIGDYANTVHIYAFDEDHDNEVAGYGLRKEGLLTLNDCILSIYPLEHWLVVITRRGIYVY